MSHEQVLELLGEPDHGSGPRTGETNELHYCTGPERLLVPLVDVEWLILKFSACGEYLGHRVWEP